MSRATVPIVFSTLTAADLDAVVDIENQSFERPWSLPLFRRELETDVSQTTLAWEGEPHRRLLGYICRWLIVDEIQILNLAVHPENRRVGIGRALVQRIIDEAASKGMRTITLEVRDGNESAMRLYESLRFRRSGVRPGYYGQGRDGVLMTLRMVLERT